MPGGSSPTEATSMNIAARWVAAGGALAALAFATLTRAPAAATVQDLGIAVPPGFTVERVAGPPLVERPIVADFDEQGRLYVADSSGSNDKVDQQLIDRTHRIVRLEDTDGDGRFDTGVVFADRMMLPQGTMWLDGSLYVAAPPSIWKLTDTTGDGVADEREEWFRGETLTGCANDLHGPYLGPDGWIYWTKGAFAQQTYDVPGGAPFVTRAAHVFRRRPGHDAVEVVLTGGMDNPVDVAFTATGERLLTATFVEHPQRGRRDALLHAIYGGVYGKPHAVVDGHPRTGDLMPVMSHLGPAVPAGLARYTSRVFGDAYRDTFFAALFNLHTVVRFTLTPDGATYGAVAEDFLVSSSRDFHPTDVVEDADGSLLVIDTGPWYKLCCPTSQLAKPDVPGAIYRVRRDTVRPPRDPRGQRLPWETMPPEDLVGLLDDRRPAVRQRAVQEAGRRGPEAVPALAAALRARGTYEARQNAVWALTRIDAAEAREAARLALADRREGVRHAAAHAAGLWRDAAAAPELVEMLRAGPPALQRAAAEALGRIGDSRTVPAIVTAAASLRDRVLEHSLTYALIEIADPAATEAAAREAASPHARRAALLARDQMTGGGLQADEVIALLDAPDPRLQDTAWWIAARHAEWGDALGAYFAGRLADAAAHDTSAAGLTAKLAQFGDAPAIQALLAAAASRDGDPAPRRAALAAMAASRTRTLPASWVTPIAASLRGQDEQAVRLAVSVLRASPPSREHASVLEEALRRIARDGTRPAELRLSALAAVRGRLATPDAAVFALLLGALGPAEPAALRALAAGIVERTALDRKQILALVPALAHAGPLELTRLLPAFDGASDESVGLALVAALDRSPGRAGLRADLLRPRLAKYPAAVRERGDALLAAVDLDGARQAERLEALLASLPEGDVRRGQAVFNSEKAACLSCHAIGYLGGTVGPDLTRIGEVRTERDLLEAIVFPSASFARSYEPVLVSTRGGALQGGMLRSEGEDEVVLATAAGEEIRIARTDIEDMQPDTVSIMPAGLDALLTAGELADLLAFLKATRWGAN
jgi:putative membrane-bound dehydrogenase-like protein